MLTVDPKMPLIISSEIGSSSGPGICAQLPHLSACCNWKHFSNPSSSFLTMPSLQNVFSLPLKTRARISSCCVCLFKMTLWPSQGLLSGAHVSLLHIHGANFDSLSWPRGWLLSILGDHHLFFFPFAAKQQSIGDWSVFPCHERWGAWDEKKWWWGGILICH